MVKTIIIYVNIITSTIIIIIIIIITMGITASPSPSCSMVDMPCLSRDGHSFLLTNLGWAFSKGAELSPWQTVCFSKNHPGGILVLDGFGWFWDFLATLMGATLHSLDSYPHINLKISADAQQGLETPAHTALGCRSVHPICSSSLPSLQLSNLSQLCQSQAQPVAKKASVLLAIHEWTAICPVAAEIPALFVVFLQPTLDHWIFLAGRQLQPFLWPFRNGPLINPCLGWSPLRNTRTASALSQ